MRLLIPIRFSLLILLGFQLLFGQNTHLDYPQPTTGDVRLQGYEMRRELQQNSIVKNLPFHSIGPVVQSGRAVDIAADPEHPQHFYVAYASGGLWYSDNNGTTFRPLFDHQAVMTIGDIAVDWTHGEIIWVGSGENNSSRSSYSGTGIYKSEDQGKTWQHMGLSESHHIGRIVLHPDHPETLWVAALGHLYSPNKQRGVYRSIDGGKTWQQTLFVNDNCGAIDLIIDPFNSDVLYAAMWERTRRAWDFTESGKGSGIYKSVDGGNTWRLLTTKGSGFPTGEGVGRIGLAVAPQNPQILDAFLDNQDRREADSDLPALTKDMLRTMSDKDFLNTAANHINAFLDRNHFPKEFNADTLYQLIRNDKIKPVTLVEYLEDANTELFDTPVIGAEIYRSEDGKKSWQRTHDDYLDKLVYSFGYYFGEIRVAPDSMDEIYVLGVPVIKSVDGGKHFSTLNRENVHVDHHALWINPANPKHLILGNDGGINISFDKGRSWLKANHPPVGQFYTVAVDMAEPYNVYGGMQDNGVWYGSHKHKPDFSWQASGKYAFEWIMGGDGMQIAVDTRDNTTVYTGFQFGNYSRLDLSGGRPVNIIPKHDLGQRPLRFNWQTPIHLSVHNQDILYLGSQKLHRSMDQGKTWQAISPDLTRGGKKGDVPYGTLTTIHESPLTFGLLYTGSDDGLIHVTQDGGHTWTRISDSLPSFFWVSRVQASAHKEQRVYAALNGYRWDNFQALIYTSEDYGHSWERIGLNLPDEPVNVIKEDPVNPDILYVGTDHGLYVSLDRGRSFMAFKEGLPDVAVHDLAIHPQEHDLIVGTHGRSIFRASLSELQQLTPKLLEQPLNMFEIPETTYRENWGERQYDWTFSLPDTLFICFYSADRGSAQWTLKGDNGTVLRSGKMSADKGLNYLPFDWTVNTETFKNFYDGKKNKDEDEKLKTADNGLFYLRPGEYTVNIRISGERAQQPLILKAPEKTSRKKAKKTP